MATATHAQREAPGDSLPPRTSAKPSVGAQRLPSTMTIWLPSSERMFAMPVRSLAVIAVALVGTATPMALALFCSAIRHGWRPE